MPVNRVETHMSPDSFQAFNYRSLIQHWVEHGDVRLDALLAGLVAQLAEAPAPFALLGLRGIGRALQEIEAMRDAQVHLSGLSRRDAYDALQVWSYPPVTIQDAIRIGRVT